MGSNDRVLVLLSGGIDSTVCAALAHQQGRLRACLSFNYGQPAASCELSMAQYWCCTHKVQWIALMLPYITGAPMRTGIGESGPRVVPARNAIFAACAANFAVSLQTPTIWYGATAADAMDYADCRKEWVSAMSEVLHLAAGVTLEAPLIDLPSTEVIALGTRLGIDWHHTWSCYQPAQGINPCGQCNACKRRHKMLGPDAIPVIERMDDPPLWKHGAALVNTIP